MSKPKIFSAILIAAWLTIAGCVAQKTFEKVLSVDDMDPSFRLAQGFADPVCVVCVVGCVVGCP